MKYFVSGANGFIGYELCKELIKNKNHVNALFRSQFPDNPSDQLSLFHGDLHDQETLDRAMNGCDYVFHLAALAQLWSKDDSVPYRTNVEGTRNILECALKNKIKKVVFVSSAAVLAPSLTNEAVDENAPLPATYLTVYEKTKYAAELLCLDYCKKGLNVVIVRPTRVFGPGFLHKSNSVTLLIKKYIKGNWRFTPGDGKSIGNYVFIEDLVRGMINASEYGKQGEKYNLGGHNLSFNEFFDLLGKVSGKNYKRFHIPVSLMFVISRFSLFLANTFSIPPLITPVWLTRYLQNRAVSSEKAKKQLHFEVTPMEVCMKKTIAWLDS